MPSARENIGCIVGIVGVLLIIIGIFASITSIQAAYAFANTARTIQGTAEISHKTVDPCGGTDGQGGCQSTTTCSTTVYFTPPDHKKPFSTIDEQCDPFTEGAKVEVLYDPNNPSTAKTARQSSEDITGGIVSTIIWPIVALVILSIIVFVIRAD